MGWDSIDSIAKDVNAGKSSAVELVEKSLKLIEKNKDFNAIISTTKDRALKRAKQIDETVKNGKSAGRLAGVPFIAKDNFLTFGGKTTAASNILKPFEEPYQATAIEKLESEGAICVAKANLDAFAHGGSTENSDFMTTKNPHDKSRVAGGSSGGSAASVALDLAPFALGTDTGGSIRQPASFDGLVGYKPTYGLVSRSGVVAMASSTDVIGPLARNVEDAALVLDVMAGKDELDGTSIERDDQSYTGSKADLKGIKVGVIQECFGDGIDPKVKSLIEKSIQKLKEAGAEISELSLPSLPFALASYYIVVPAEISSNLSRYDGQRYGHSSEKAKNLDDSYELSRSEGFGDEAKRRILIGTYVLSSGYYDAYYRTAQKLRTKLIREFEKAFKDVQFLLTPTTTNPAFKIGEMADKPLQMYLQDLMTVPANLVGIPAISIPAGNVNKLPVGLQLMAPSRYDRQLLAVAKAAEEII